MRWVVLIVAVVPYEIAPMCGSSAPEPSTSHALSAAAETIGVPAASPRCAAAAAVRSPSRPVGGMSSGSLAGSIGTARHFQSEVAAQRRPL